MQLSGLNHLKPATNWQQTIKTITTTIYNNQKTAANSQNQQKTANKCNKPLKNSQNPRDDEIQIMTKAGISAIRPPLCHSKACMFLANVDQMSNWPACSKSGSDKRLPFDILMQHNYTQSNINLSQIKINLIKMAANLDTKHVGHAKELRHPLGKFLEFPSDNWSLPSHKPLPSPGLRFDSDASLLLLQLLHVCWDVSWIWLMNLMKSCDCVYRYNLPLTPSLQLADQPRCHHICRDIGSHFSPWNKARRLRGQGFCSNISQRSGQTPMVPGCSRIVLPV